MAAATLVRSKHGIRAHTGTDATTVVASHTQVRAIEVMGTAGGETVAVTDVKGEPLLNVVASTANQSEIYDMRDVMVEGIKVTLSAATVRAIFFIR